MFCAAPAELVL